MSIWALGRLPAGQVVTQASENDMAKFVGKVLKWIPADLALLYTVFIKALVDSPQDDPSVWLTILFVALAPITVLLVSFASKDGVTGPALRIRAALAVPAFAIWSLTVPNSGWDTIEQVADNPAWTAGLAALGGFFFSLVAEGIENRSAP